MDCTTGSDSTRLWVIFAGGDHVLFAPPFIVTEDDVAKIIDLFELAMNDVFTAEGLS